MAPVIVSFSQKFMNIWEIPFAAVTICPIGGPTPLNKNYSINGPESVNHLNNFTGSVDTRITSCKWRNNEMNSSDLFTEIATEEGFCYTFNMLNFQDLFKDDV
jgi:Amiloride-sensitive sodium channel